jgi:hypothetical protein
MPVVPWIDRFSEVGKYFPERLKKGLTIEVEKSIIYLVARMAESTELKSSKLFSSNLKKVVDKAITFW